MLVKIGTNSYIITSKSRTYKNISESDVDKKINKFLLALHGAQSFVAFYSTTITLVFYVSQIFSSNLSKTITIGGIKWSLCRVDCS